MTMQSALAFFSFTEVPDQADHRAYNEWHDLDHRPENLALPGVRWGQRWVRTPAARVLDVVAAQPLTELHYLNSYLFDPPVDRSLRRWQDLAERSFQWGRRPDVAIARRLLMGAFDPVRGYAADRVLVDASILPLRPNRGVELTVTRPLAPHSPATEAYYRWEDRTLVPALLARPEVAGTWAFASRSTTLDAGWAARPGTTTFDTDTAAETGQLRVRLVYLDGDPLAYAATARPEADDAPVEILFQGVLESITAWQWSWFD